MPLGDFRLPAMPQVARECLLYLYKPDADVALLAKSLRRDPGITAAILNLANSTAFCAQASGKTSDLRAGIMRIGMSTLRQILVQQALESTLRFDSANFFNLKTFCRHGAFVGQMAFSLAEKACPERAWDLHLSGLLHDVGLAVRAIAQKDSMDALTHHCRDNGCDFSTAEQALKLEPHGVTGFMALSAWEIPEEVKCLIRWHHPLPGEFIPDEHILPVQILRLSDVLAHSYGLGFTDYKRNTKVEVTLLERLGLAPVDIRQMVQEVMQSLPQGS